MLGASLGNMEIDSSIVDSYQKVFITLLSSVRQEEIISLSGFPCSAASLYKTQQIDDIFCILGCSCILCG